MKANALRREPTEAQFMQQVIQFARLNNWACYHTHDSRRSEPGFPDLVMVRRHSILFVELKVGRNKTTPAQDAWLTLLRNTGCFAAVWYPRDWDEIERILSEV